MTMMRRRRATSKRTSRRHYHERSSVVFVSSFRLVLILLGFISSRSLVHSWTFPKSAFPSIAIRGFDTTSYGTATNNSTIPDSNEVAAIVGVKPCMKAPKFVWSFVWTWHGRLLPLLHFRDAAQTFDSSKSLKVLWCKAISSMDRSSSSSSSKVYDDGWTYDTLPSISRLLLRIIPNRWFPRLHHANIEARTAYLNNAIQTEIDRVASSSNTSTTIQLISLGAGYDVRCSRLLSQSNNNDDDKIRIEAYELDLEDVLVSKQKILDRLKRRRPAESSRHPTLIPIDLNNVDSVQQTLEKIMAPNSENGEVKKYTIFISEGVMIYLDKGVPSRLLRLMRDCVIQSTSSNSNSSSCLASFCFADLLENIPGGDRMAAEREVSSAGMELVDWCPKPGLARHMGVARVMQQQQQQQQ